LTIEAGALLFNFSVKYPRIKEIPMRLLAVLLVGLLCIALSSCPGKGGGDDTTGVSNNTTNNSDDGSSSEDVWDE
jgi:hypothetical protein